MKAAVFKGKGSLAVEEVPTPTVGPGQVLVKVKYCAICGSDVHRGFIFGMMTPGTVMGHEYCGTIAQVGEGVTQWKVGDRVVGGGGTPAPGAFPRLSATARYSARQLGFMASGTMGGFAEYVLIDAWRPLPIPTGVSDEAAALAEPCTVAVHAVRLSQIKLGDSVAVIGAGPIGLFVLQCARAAGATRVYVSEPAPARVRAALELGADQVLDPTQVNVVEEMLKLTEGLGPDLVFECAGAPSTLQQALEMVRRSGRVIMVSLAWEETPTLPVEWVGREVELKCSYGATPQEWRTSLELMRQGKVRVEPMIGPNDYVSLANIQQAFEALVRPSDHIQIMVQC